MTNNYRRDDEKTTSLDHNYHIHNNPSLMIASFMKAVLLVNILTTYAHKSYTSSTKVSRLHTALEPAWSSSQSIVMLAQALEMSSRKASSKSFSKSIFD